MKTNEYIEYNWENKWPKLKLESSRLQWIENILTTNYYNKTTFWSERDFWLISIKQNYTFPVYQNVYFKKFNVYYVGELTVAYIHFIKCFIDQGRIIHHATSWRCRMHFYNVCMSIRICNSKFHIIAAWQQITVCHRHSHWNMT